MNVEAPHARTPKWDTVFLVCKECGQRRGAPKDAKPKKLAAELRGLTRDDSTRSRVVMSPCLGLCPKGGVAVTRIGGSAPASLVAIEHRAQLETWYVAARRPRETPRSDDR